MYQKDYVRLLVQLEEIRETIASDNWQQVREANQTLVDIVEAILHHINDLQQYDIIKKTDISKTLHFD